MTRNSRLVLIGLCGVLGLAVLGELVAPLLTGSSDSLETSRRRDEQLTAKKADALVAEILQRPLFVQSRRPPQPKIVKAEPPRLQGRLAGVMLQSDVREALFARPGGKAIAVKVGDTIDGFTVGKIDADQVVLTSAFGDQVVKPTNGAPDEIAAPPARPAAKKPGPVAIPQAKPMLVPRGPNMGPRGRQAAAMFGQPGAPGL
jgi:type II secretory pathway component PulC